METQEPRFVANPGTHPSTPATPSDCLVEVDAERELMITSLAVVEDPERTVWNGDLEDPTSGAWSFGRIATNLAGENPVDEFVTQWLQTWRNTVVVNGQDVAPRNGLSGVLLGWPRLPDGTIDMTQSPFRLLAISNRVDLADSESAGEGRFVFGLVENGEPIEFVINLEYSLSHDEWTTLEWAEAWHALGDHPLGSPEYNAALQAITDRFAGPTPPAVDTAGEVAKRGLSQIVSNENAFGNGIWEQRHFKLDADGLLTMRTLPLTPAPSFNGSETLRNFLIEYEAAILDGTYEVPLEYEEQPFLAASTKYDGEAWKVRPPIDNEARHLFSLNTCDGCHGGETATDFLHVQNRAAGEETVLSGFLTGSDVVDPYDGKTVRSYHELQRRADALEATLCAD